MQQEINYGIRTGGKQALITIFLIALLFFYGCEENSLAPQQPDTFNPPEVVWIDSLIQAQGVTTVSIAVSHEKPLQSVKVYVDGHQAWEWESPTSDTISFVWDSRTVIDGPHSIEFRIWDEDSKLGISPMRIVLVANETEFAPVFTWLNTPRFPWAGIVELKFRVISETPVAKLCFHLDSDTTALDSLTGITLDDTLTFYLNTTLIPDGYHLLYTRLLSTANRSSYTAPLLIEIANDIDTPPHLSWINPPASPWRGAVTLNYRIESTIPVSVLRFYLDVDPLPLDSLLDPAVGELLAWTWDTREIPDGFHLLHAEPIDTAGRVGNSLPLPVELRNADAIPPFVRWDYPEAGTAMSGLVGLPFRVMDEGGIHDIEVFVNGQEGNGEIQDDVGEERFLYQWNSEIVNDGYYSFEVFATDSAGNTGRSPVLLARTLNQGLPRTIHVPGEAQTLQSAINESRSGDTIRVASGTYNEGLNFFGKNIWFESEEGPEVTIIDATGWTYGIFANSGEDTTMVVRGFTIQNSVARAFYITSSSISIYNCIIRSNPDHGILCSNSSLSNITNCIFDNNRTNIALSYSWGRCYNTVSINANDYGIWNIAVLPNPLNYGYNLFNNNRINFNDPPLQAETDIFEDPLFIPGTYQLQEESPCIDSGNPGIQDINGTRSDIGVYGGPYAYPIPN